MSKINTFPSTPRSLIDPKGRSAPANTMSKWALFLGDITTGTPLQDAMLKHRMKRAEIEACIRLSPEERQRWNDARMAARKRAWSAFDLEDIFAKIAAGTPVLKAIAAVRPVFNPEKGGSSVVEDFMKLCTQDPEFKEMYEFALKSRAVIASEQIIDIADGDGRDYLDNGKGGFTPDGAKVNRDKLRVETRRGLMSAWYPKLFSENKGDVQVNVQVNHAQRLEEARARRDTRSANRSPTAIVDAVFNDRPAVEEAKPDWDDLPTIWREET
jgi:hypothetical protein